MCGCVCDVCCVFACVCWVCALCSPGLLFVLSSKLPLHAAWVQHDAHSGAHGLGGEVAAELGTHDTSVAVCAHDAAPHDAVLAVLCLVQSDA